MSGFNAADSDTYKNMLLLDAPISGSDCLAAVTSGQCPVLLEGAACCPCETYKLYANTGAH